MPSSPDKINLEKFIIPLDLVRGNKLVPQRPLVYRGPQGREYPATYEGFVSMRQDRDRALDAQKIPPHHQTPAEVAQEIEGWRQRVYSDQGNPVQRDGYLANASAARSQIEDYRRHSWRLTEPLQAWDLHFHRFGDRS